ncbi:hypothetical protein [Streptomyces sp. NPDC015130]|uniref:hypothetical protein n=1 Tax=Streptomyces sp. NPDC015130 TaxID=3364940 RepID=UPI0037007471
MPADEVLPVGVLPPPAGAWGPAVGFGALVAGAGFVAVVLELADLCCFGAGAGAGACCGLLCFGAGAGAFGPGAGTGAGALRGADDDDDEAGDEGAFGAGPGRGAGGDFGAGAGFDGFDPAPDADDPDGCLGSWFTGAFRARAASAEACAFFTSSRFSFASAPLRQRSAPARSHARITLGGVFPALLRFFSVAEFWAVFVVSSTGVWNAELLAACGPVGPFWASAGGVRAGVTGVSSAPSREAEVGFAGVPDVLPAGLPGTGRGAGGVLADISILTLCGYLRLTSSRPEARKTTAQGPIQAGRAGFSGREVGSR